MRKSNFELLRLLAVVGVMIVHADFGVFGVPIHSDGFCNSVSRYFWQFVSSASVNVFILISGYFGIHLKVKSVLRFLFILVFWRILILSLSNFTGVLGDHQILLSVANCNPIRGWFIKCYLGLLLLSPILNSFFNGTRKELIKKYLLWFFLIQFVSEIFFPLWNIFEFGYSTISFIGLYLLGRCLGDSKMSLKLPMWVRLDVAIASLFFAAMFVYGLSGFDSLILRIMHDRALTLFTAYSSPIVVLLGVCFLMSFARLNFLSRFVNHIALSVFPIYLAHVLPYYNDFVKVAYGKFGYFGVGGVCC